MPLLILGKDPSNYLKVDPTLAALHVTVRPFETSNKAWIHSATKTGTLAAATAAGVPLYSLQNLSTNLLAIKRVKVCYSNLTFTTAQYVDFGLIISRGISVYTTGGTAVLLQGNNSKLFSEGNSLSQVNCRVATTGTLTAGTRTLDTNYIGQCGNWVTGVSTGIPLTTIFEALPGKHPIILAQNEGIEIQLLTTLGTGLTGVLGVTVEFAEALAY
jgi:hypothetical protein